MSFDPVLDAPTTGTSYLRVRTVTDPADGGRARLTLLGELEGDTTDVLHEAVVAALDGPAPEFLELDLASVSFLDSAGIRCLLNCREDAQARHCRLTVVDPDPAVYRVLEITGLLDVFGVPQPVRLPRRRLPRVS